MHTTYDDVQRRWTDGVHPKEGNVFLLHPIRVDLLDARAKDAIGPGWWNRNP